MTAAALTTAAPPPARANDVRIYQLALAFDYWCWLCTPCLTRKLVAGWQVRVTKAPPHPQLTCDDCRLRGAAA